MPRPARRSKDGPFDIRSFARRGPANRPLTFSEVAAIRRTVGGAPEVFVRGKAGANSNAAAAERIDYITRNGEVPLEADEGAPLTGPDVAEELIRDWNLDLSWGEHAPRSRSSKVDRPAQLHLVTLSPGADVSDRTLAASVHAFAQAAFPGHRYAFALHRDTGHAHAHLVVKAEDEGGARRNFSREEHLAWRELYAEELRALGVAVNATRRRDRGARGLNLKPALAKAQSHRPSRWFTKEKALIVDALREGGLPPDPAAEQVRRSRAEVERGWSAAADRLRDEGYSELARQADAFIASMQPALTRREMLRQAMLKRARADRAQEETRRPPVRDRGEDLTR